VIAFNEKKERDEAEKAKAEAEEEEQQGQFNQHVSDVEAGIIRDDNEIQGVSNIPFQGVPAPDPVSRVSRASRTSVRTSGTSATEESRRISGASGSGLSSENRASMKNRKKSILMQIAEETRNVVMETINPYYQPQTETTNKKPSATSTAATTDKENPLEEDSRQSTSLLTRQIVSPLRSALALRSAGSRISVPKEQLQKREEEIHEKEIELSDTSSGSRDDKNNAERNSCDEQEQNMHHDKDSGVDSPLHSNSKKG
jgi:hypothetical protein